MDYLINFTNYLLTICSDIGYSIGMKWGTRKKNLVFQDFICTCGSNSFYVFTKDVDYSRGLEQYEIINCQNCHSKYKSGGRDEQGNLLTFRQGALSDEWESMGDGRTLN